METKKIILDYWLIPQIVKSPEEVSAKIIDVVCKDYEVEFITINVKIQVQEKVIVRQLIMYYLRKYTNLSLPAIGRKFKGRNGDGFNHATVIFGIQQINDLIDTRDREMVSRVKRLNEIFEGGHLFKEVLHNDEERYNAHKHKMQTA